MNDITKADSGTSLVKRIATKYHVDPNKMLHTLKQTAFKQGKDKPEVTNEQMMALMVVADQYDLNPFTRQIYAFAQGGGIVPVVPIDGWMAIINRNPEFDGMEFDDKFDDAGKIFSITCRMYRKDRSHSVEVTEYLSECSKPTSPWQKWPVRMLRHKATIQAARYAFGLSGIFDDDEADRIVEVNDAPHETSTGMNEVVEGELVDELPAMSDNVFNDNITVAKSLILGKKKTAQQVTDMLATKYTLSEDQENEISALEELIEDEND